MSHGHVGPPKTDGSWVRWERCGSWERPDKTWSTGKGNSTPLQYSSLENPMNSMKRQTEMSLKDELLRLVGAQYATGEKWRNSSRKNEEAEPKRKQSPVVDVASDGSSLML